MSPPDPIPDKRLTMLYQYWLQRRGDRAMPARRDLDPVDIPTLLPHLMLAEVGDDVDFRYRLAGTAVTRAAGTELTGRSVASAGSDPDFRDRLLACLHRVAATSQPLYSQGPYPRVGKPDAQPWYVASVMLPLSEDGCTVNMILGAQVFTTNPLAPAAHAMDPTPAAYALQE